MRPGCAAEVDADAFQQRSTTLYRVSYACVLCICFMTKRITDSSPPAVRYYYYY